MQSDAEAALRLRQWGDTKLSPQQNRVWRLLVTQRDCSIDRLFRAARPESEPMQQRKQQQIVGTIVWRINSVLAANAAIRPGTKRYSYRLRVDVG